MIKTVKCEKCGAVSKYDDRSVWEGLRDLEEVTCPKCGNVLDKVFTDLTPVATLVEETSDNIDELNHFSTDN